MAEQNNMTNVRGLGTAVVLRRTIQIDRGYQPEHNFHVLLGGGDHGLCVVKWMSLRKASFAMHASPDKIDA